MHRSGFCVVLLVILALAVPAGSDPTGPTPSAAPPAPTGLQAAVSGTTVALTWSPSAPETAVDHYIVLRSTQFDDTLAGYVDASAPLPPGSWTWTDPAPAVGGTFYAVAAVSSGGERGPFPGQAASFVRPIPPGRHLVSTPVAAASTAIADAAGRTSWTVAGTFDPEDPGDPWKRATGSGGDLAGADRRHGLWIDVAAGGDYRVAGRVPCATPILLRTGWNLVGFPAMAPRTVGSAFAGLSGPLRVEGPGSGPYGLRVLGAADLMTPTEGYWVESPVDQVWTVVNSAAYDCVGGGGYVAEAPGPGLAVDSPITPTAGTGLALVPSYPGEVVDWTLPDYEQTHSLLAQAGVRLAQQYRTWGELELSPGTYSWSDLDFYVDLADRHGLGLSLVVKILDGGNVGALPADLTLTTFDDPAFVSRFRTFLLDLTARYDGRLDYLWIGNEVDNYLRAHRGEIPAYSALYEQAYAAVKLAHPWLRVGTISTYHDAVRNDALDIIQGLGPQGDLLGFSYYPQLLGGSPFGPGADLDAMAAVAVAASRPFAITESGWSSAGFGSFEALQAIFTGEILAAYGQRRGGVEYLTLFLLYDFPPSLVAAVSAYYGIAYGEYGDWLGSLGLGTNAGTAKAAWAAFLAGSRGLAA